VYAGICEKGETTEGGYLGCARVIIGPRRWGEKKPAAEKRPGNTHGDRGTGRMNAKSSAKLKKETVSIQ